MASFVILIITMLIASSELPNGASSVVGYYPMASSCSTNGNYSIPSQYHENLRQLLSVLPTEVITGGGFTQQAVGASPDAVFSLMMCFADRKLDECQYCLSASTTSIMQLCPYSQDVNGSYDACLLRYADAPMAPVADTTVAFHVVHTADATVDAAAMEGVRARLMLRLGAAAAASPSLASAEHQGETPSSSSSGGRTWLVASISAAGSVAALLFLCLFICFLMRRKQATNNKMMPNEDPDEEGGFFNDDEAMEDEFENGTGPKRFRYDQLAAATDNFSDGRMLGQGGFGSVYQAGEEGVCVRGEDHK